MQDPNYKYIPAELVYIGSRILRILTTRYNRRLYPQQTFGLTINIYQLALYPTKLHLARSLISRWYILVKEPKDLPPVRGTTSLPLGHAAHVLEKTSSPLAAEFLRNSNHEIQSSVVSSHEEQHSCSSRRHL